jgi:hypothetical protein
LLNARTGLCWEGSYAEGDVKKNDTGQFTAKSRALRRTAGWVLAELL